MEGIFWVMLIEGRGYFFVVRSFLEGDLIDEFGELSLGVLGFSFWFLDYSL